MIYIVNGFSNGMFIDPRIKRIDEPLSKQEFIEKVLNTKWKSAIGHKQMADCLTKLCGVTIPHDRINLNIGYDDVLLLVSLKGRLPEHPSYVDYKNRLMFSLVRFEKQTLKDIEKSQKILKEITMEA